MLTQWFEPKGKWISFNLVFPPNDLIPGQSGNKPISVMISELVTLIYELIFGASYHESHSLWEMLKEDVLHLFGYKTEIEQANSEYLEKHDHHNFFEDILHELGLRIAKTTPHLFIIPVIEMLKKLEKNPFWYDKIIYLLKSFEKWFEIFCNLFPKDSEKMYWIKVMGELGLVAIRGFLEDIYDPQTGKMDFDKINHLDFREWLKEKGLSDLALASAPVRFIYTGTFANLIGGDGLIGAGTAMNFLAASMGYKGSFVWKFKAGTGDTMVAPIYLALKHRGVNFKFFHEVLQVHHSTSGEIEKISMAKQVDLLDESKPYEPLIQVNNIWAWPSHPLYKQLNPEQAILLQTENINLESAWSPWKNVSEFTLEKGLNFDYAVLGVPIAALGGEKGICQEIIEANTAWKQMYKEVKTTITSSVQMWISPDYEELGMNLTDWGITGTSKPNLVTYASPIYSWIDMSLVLSQETWQTDKKPKLLVYYCGSDNDPIYPHPFSETNYPAQTIENLLNTMRQWLQDNMGLFWTNGTSIEYPQGFDLNLLFDMYDRISASGEEKLLSQYWRYNINPWDRYTLSVPNSGKHRLKTDKSGYKNLFLTGDWIDFGVNVGYIEGAVNSGIQAAQSLRNALNLNNREDYFGELVF